MDLAEYYELKYQPHNLRAFPETIANQTNDGEDRMQLQPSSINRSRSSVCSSSHQCSTVSGEGTAVHPALHHPAVAGDGRVTAQHLEELRKERQDLHNNTQYTALQQILIYYAITYITYAVIIVQLCTVMSSHAAFLILCSQCQNAVIGTFCS